MQSVQLLSHAWSGYDNCIVVYVLLPLSTFTLSETLTALKGNIPMALYEPATESFAMFKWNVNVVFV